MSVNTEVGEDASQVHVHRAQPSNEEGSNVSKERIKEEEKGGSYSARVIELQGMPPPSTLIGYGVSSELMRVPQSSLCPSTLIGDSAFDQTTFREILKPHVQSGATLTSKSLPGQDVVLVRPRTHDGPTNRKDHGSSSGDEKIPAEEVVCRFCFIQLKEENKVLKTNCRCSNTLTHEECLANWSTEKGNSNCDFCGQEVQSFPVTLFRGFNSSPGTDSQGTKKHWLFSWLIRILKGSF